MHSIIIKNKKTGIGAKAENLIRLDKKNLCPNFLVLDSSVFFDHLKKPDFSNLDKNQMKKIIFENMFDDNLLSEINKGLINLNIKNPILRSSYFFEDTEKHSFAGLFDSIKCPAKHIPENIKKVWHSQFNPRAAEYIRTKGIKQKTGMGVIIQEYIEPDLGGVAFYNKKDSSLFVEFAEGSSSDVELGRINPKIFALKNGFLLLNDKKVKNYGFINSFKNLPKEINEFGWENADLEFVVRNGKVWITQMRKITAPLRVREHFIFRSAEKHGLHVEDVSLSNLNLLLEKLGFRTRIQSMEKKSSDILIDYGSYSKIIEETYIKILDKKIIDKFIEKILKFQEKQAQTSLEKEKSAKDYIIKFKRFQITLFFIDYLINRFLIFALKEYLQEKLKINEESRPDIFRPDKLTLTSMNLLSIFKSGKALYSNILSQPGLIKKMPGKSAMELRMKLQKKSGQKLESNVPVVNNLQKLLWLHDANNYFIEVVSHNYARLFYMETKSDINPLCKLPFRVILEKTIPQIIREAEKIREAKKEVPTGKKRRFPLNGKIASPGNFEGKAKIIDFVGRKEEVNPGDILVAEETSPSLVTAMAVCRGVITERGGLISHAAIVCRELEIPCLVGVDGCTDLIKTGDYLEVTNGKIYKK
ncbi:hypothetical protein JW707_05140 [Candidatus Woesearchaeota archaeon]|nr:hypothetical protein [Candidatus Woesearchaeota archaeon]